MPVRLGNRALRDHADLGAAADDDDALAVDGLKRRHRRHAGHAGHGLDVSDQPALIDRSRDLELDLGDRTFARAARDVADVGPVAEDDLRDAVQDARFVAALDEQTGDAGSGHGRER